MLRIKNKKHLRNIKAQNIWQDGFLRNKENLIVIK